MTSTAPRDMLEAEDLEKLVQGEPLLITIHGNDITLYAARDGRPSTLSHRSDGKNTYAARVRELPNPKTGDATLWIVLSTKAGRIGKAVLAWRDLVRRNDRGDARVTVKKRRSP